MKMTRNGGGEGVLGVHSNLELHHMDGTTHFYISNLTACNLNVWKFIFMIYIYALLPLCFIFYYLEYLHIF